MRGGNIAQFSPATLPPQLRRPSPESSLLDSIPWVPRVSPRGEEAGPARDELRVPGEEEDGEYAEKDEHGLFGKPVAQRCRHHCDRGLWLDHSTGSPQAGAHWV